MVGAAAVSEATMSRMRTILYCVTCRQDRLFVAARPSIGDWLLALNSRWLADEKGREVHLFSLWHHR